MINLHGKIFKYAGPPGTGKSTTLLGVVERYLEGGVPPEDIVYTTFTRAGAYEARDRACARFNLPPARFPYFRTLHSLCYQELGQVDVMQAGDWCTLASILGVGFSLRFGPDEGVPRGRTKGDSMMSLWSLARVRMEPVAKVYQDRHLHSIALPDLSLQELEHFIATIIEYKKATGKIDYTDMLEQWIERGTCGAPHLIVDEAQDLSLLQWRVVEKLSSHAQETHIAGDDDQCIHEWNGAAPQLFIQLPAESYSVLPQSYRVPKQVHTLATTVVGQIVDRLPKEYKSRDEEGKVERVGDFAQLDMSKGTWFVLARNNHLLDELAAEVELKGFLYTGHTQKSMTRIVDAIRTWQGLCKGEPRSLEQCQQMYLLMSQRDRVVRGCKSKLQQAKVATLTLDQLRKDYGCLAQGPWTLALDMIHEKDRAYLEAIEKNEGLEAGARIELSTIHGAKGREADHVVLCPDMTFRTWDAFQSLPDAEHRVWYVGVTRARKSLHILPAQSECHYPI